MGRDIFEAMGLREITLDDGRWAYVNENGDIIFEGNLFFKIHEEVEACIRSMYGQDGERAIRIYH